ncbi:MAG: hypothetical protein WBZ04_05085, partial [Candidatus Nanopelagicales bacterium]
DQSRGLRHTPLPGSGHRPGAGTRLNNNAITAMNPIATLAAPLGDPADDGTDRVVAEQRADRLPDGSSTAKVAVSDRFMRSGAAKRWALADSPVSLRAAAAMDTEIGAADGTRPIRSSLPARIAVDTESGGFPSELHGGVKRWKQRSR